VDRTFNGRERVRVRESCWVRQRVRRASFKELLFSSSN
jgi:hypothetical protein